MPKISSANIKEYAQLFWINLLVQKRNFVEFAKIVSHYYLNPVFRKIDLELLRTYLFNNPFTISKRFLQNRGEENVYAYGETPLTTMERIVKECKISSKDTVFELGCGRGRTCFWLHSFVGCRVVGIEYLPEFVNRANQIKNKFQIENIDFRVVDMLHADYTGATVIYLYGTCLEDDFIQKLIARLKKLPSGTKIITVSYSLAEYLDSNSLSSLPEFEVMKRFPARYTWGEAEVYLQIKK